MNTNHKRLKFDFAPEAVESLDRLVSDLGAASRAEVIRRALRLMQRAVDAEREGGMLVIQESDGRERGVFLV